MNLYTLVLLSLPLRVILPCILEVSSPSRDLPPLATAYKANSVWGRTQGWLRPASSLWSKHQREREEEIKKAIPELHPSHSGPGRGPSQKPSLPWVGLAQEEHSSWKKGGLPSRRVPIPFKSARGLINHYLCPVETVNMHPASLAPSVKLLSQKFLLNSLSLFASDKLLQR